MTVGVHADVGDSQIAHRRSPSACAETVAQKCKLLSGHSDVKALFYRLH
ncbi:MAG: hypothetical protein LBJ67_09555 [Planctomycetaceae bacterium]|nr:hypothetical protein [Planctomycetaceae bacterium]